MNKIKNTTNMIMNISMSRNRFAPSTNKTLLPLLFCMQRAAAFL